MNVAHGSITPDPLQQVEEGYSLFIEGQLFPAKELAHIDNWTAFNGVVCGLMAHDETGNRCPGSAVLIAPGLALAANHVIKDEITGIINDRTACFCLAPTPWGLDVWRVVGFAGAHPSDVNILQLVRASAMPPVETPMRHAVIAHSMPKVGEPISMVGFVGEPYEGADTDPAAYNYPADLVRAGLHVFQGEVLEQFPMGMRAGRVPAPCFAVSHGAPGGLSGGPAFDGEGRLVGIVSSAFGEGPESCAIVSLFENTLDWSIDTVWPWQLRTERQRLRQILAGYDAIDGA